MASRIEDYGLIGDCHSAALVSREGSIDWLCLPSFDAQACFAALLGTPQNGRWQIAPAGGIRRITRRYRPDTLVLETTFESETGTAQLIDFMTPHTEHSRVVRMVVGRSGEVAMRMHLVLRYDYGLIVPWVSRTEHAWRAVGGPDAVLLHTPCRTRGEGPSTVADFVVRAGETAPFVLTWHASHDPEPPELDAPAALDQTQRWWRAWTGHCTYDGPWREAVVRSLITLKALTYAPTGGIVAAVTTSLPEWIGSVRNWDYRFCWLRDAAFTLATLMRSGYTEEARDWRTWLVRAVAGTPSQLNIMYGLRGERRLTELELDWLPGYEHSRPVRVGNDAHRQFQLDVFGEVMATLHLARVGGLQADRHAWEVEREMLRFLESAWTQPDEGIWEVRGPRRHFTHSKIMAWFAVDRMIASAEQFGLEGPLERWRELRQAIHEDVCRNGYDAERNTFVQYYGGKALDASLLMLPQIGFLPAADPRLRGTVDAVQRELMSHGFVRRYITQPEVDGLPPGEGMFIPCTLWLAGALSDIGRRDEAIELYERVLALRNDLGLLSEEYDPVARRLLGNFPQALSHIGIVGTALRLKGAGSIRGNPEAAAISRRV